MRKLSTLGAVALLALALGCAQSDGGITAKVKSKLIADSAVPATEINVDTKNHVVTMTGTVDSPEAREKALEIARSTEGVTRVVDNLVVKQEDVAGARTMTEAVAETVDDAAITAKVKTKLLADSILGGLKIDVDTHDGVVTLSGDRLKSQAEIDQAIRLARQVDGVREVRSNLTVQNA